MSVRGNILAFPPPEVTMAPIVLVLVNMTPTYMMITLIIVKMTVTSEQDKMQTQLAAHFQPSFRLMVHIEHFVTKSTVL